MSRTTTAELNHPAPGAAPHADDTSKQWTITTREGLKVAGYQPTWATENPNRTGVHLDDLLFVLGDILHWATFPGAPLLTFASPAQHHATATLPGTIEPDDMIFTSTIECRPYAEHPNQRVPTASFHITEDCWMNGLDADALSRLAARLRAQADHLDREVRPALVAARTDWATHTATAPPGGTP